MPKGAGTSDRQKGRLQNAKQQPQMQNTLTFPFLRPSRSLSMTHLEHAVCRSLYPLSCSQYKGGKTGVGNEGICEAEQRTRRVRKGD